MDITTIGLLLFRLTTAIVYGMCPIRFGLLSWLWFLTIQV